MISWGNPENGLRFDICGKPEVVGRCLELQLSETPGIDPTQRLQCKPSVFNATLGAGNHMALLEEIGDW